MIDQRFGKMFFPKMSFFLCHCVIWTASTQELEPLCNDDKTEKWVIIAETISKKKKKLNNKKRSFRLLCRKTDLVVKRCVRPYALEMKFKNAHTDRENFGFADDNKNLNRIDNKALVNGGHAAHTLYRDVVELRKKAEEYKVCSYSDLLLTFARFVIEMIFHSTESWLGRRNQSRII